jgi:hypothetical protein
MTKYAQIVNTLKSSISLNLLSLRNRETIIEFFFITFSDNQRVISSENVHNKLADFLEDRQVENDEDSQITAFDTYEEKAKKYILNWTNQGFLTNFFDNQGNVFYELSTHSNKTIDWLMSLKKEEFVGTESKFNSILYQLKELVEFTNEDIEKRLELLEEKKLEIEQQIQRIKTGENVKVFEEFEIVPRFNKLNQSAKELLSDFKEVEENFREITKAIYQKHAEGSQNKSDILEFAFDAIDALKDSQQGKSFYAFYKFLLSPQLQEQWKNLIEELYNTLEAKEIPINDLFLKGMKRHLHSSGRKVYKANDKMAEKLSRIIRENDNSKLETTKKLIQEIKKELIEISQAKTKPTISLELESENEINIHFERMLTFQQKEEVVYSEKIQMANQDVSSSEKISKVFSQTSIDKEELRKRIREMLTEKSQFTLLEVIEKQGGLEKGLSEFFGYMSILKEFKHTINSEKTQNLVFDIQNRKQIKIPTIILTK